MADRQVLMQQLQYHNSFYLYEESCILNSIAAIAVSQQLLSL